jgi:hypothetical protein
MIPLSSAVTARFYNEGTDWNRLAEGYVLWHDESMTHVVALESAIFNLRPRKIEEDVVCYRRGESFLVNRYGCVLLKIALITPHS